MSIYATEWAYAQDVKPSGRKFVLVAIANFADAEGRAYPGVSTLAQMTGQDERSVRRHIDALEEAKLIRATSRRRSDGSRTTDDIHLLAPPDALLPKSGETEKGKRRRRQADKLSGSEGGQQADNLSGSQADNLSGPTGQSVIPNRTICQGLPDTVSGHEPSDEPSVEPSGTDRQTAAAVMTSEDNSGPVHQEPDEQRSRLPGGASLAALVGAFRPWNVRDLMAEYATRSHWTEIPPERIRELHTLARDQHGRRYRGDLAELLDAEVRQHVQPSGAAVADPDRADEIDMRALIDGAPLEGSRRKTA